MAKEKEFEMPEDIPSWLMTFSDVITLLMTFFILLLTFATNQPETFERMQVSMFAGGGASGIAGPAQTPLELDAIIMRQRSRAGRITQRGAEMPPINTDPVLNSLSSGLKGLEESERRELATQHAASIPVSQLVNDDGKITSLGQQQLKMLARHVRRKPFDVKLVASENDALDRTHTLAWSLHADHGVEIHKVSVGRSTAWKNEEPLITFVLTNPLDGAKHGREN